MESMRIKRLFIYPVKSLLPVEVSMAEITTEGFRFDRQYILIKGDGDPSQTAEHLTIKTTFRLCLFQPEISEDWSTLTITHLLAQPRSSITIPLTVSPLSTVNARSYHVNIFGTTATGIDTGDESAAFFSRHLEMPVRLLYMPSSDCRDIPGATGLTQPHVLNAPGAQSRQIIQKIRFSDASPFLVTSSASEAEIRSRLPLEARHQDVITRFRPNIHVDVGPVVKPWEEDQWTQLVVTPQDSEAHKATIRCIFKTPRCLSVNVDYANGELLPRDRQLYGLLARDRRVNSSAPHKPVFGQYAIAGPIGAVLHVGDKVHNRSKDLRAKDTKTSA